MDRKNHIVLWASIVVSLFSMGAQAQEQDEKFKEIDSMIERMSQSKEKPADVQLVELPKKDVPIPEKIIETPQKKTEAAEPSSQEIKPSYRAKKEEVTDTPNANVRLTDLPPNTRFDLRNQVFIPAYKKAVMFIDGEIEKAIDSTANVTKELLDVPLSSSVCVMKSSKSYVMMFGYSETPSKATYFEVEGVQFLKGQNSDGDEVFLAEVSFKKKQPKNNGIELEDGVKVDLSCQVPVKYHDNVRRYSLKDLNQGFGGIFDFVLPQFIEI